LGLLLLAVLALAVRLRGLGWGLPEFYEEATPFRVAWRLWAFGPESFTGNPHFFKYPTLVIYLQFAGQALLMAALFLARRIQSVVDFQVLYAVDKTPFVLVGRAIIALLGAATVPITHGLVRRLLASHARKPEPMPAALVQGAAWTAAALVAISPALVAKSQVIDVDVPLAFFVALAAWIALGLFERLTPRACLLAGAAVGLAASTKYTGAIALIPCAFALGSADAAALRGFLPSARPRNPSPRAMERKGRAANPPRKAAGPGRAWGARGLALGLVLAAAVAAFILTSPYVLLDFTAFQADLGAEKQHMSLGHFGASAGSSWGFYAQEYVTHLVGWPLGLASMAAIAAAILGFRRAPRAAALATTVVIYFAVVGSWSMKADRYLLPMLPLVTALVTAGIARMLAGRSAIFSRPAAATGTWVAIGLLCAIPTLGEWKPIRDRQVPDPRLMARRWIEANAPDGAFIVLEPYGPPLLGPRDLLAMPADVAARLLTGPARPRVYATLTMPMFQVAPERSSPYYDLGLYPAVDLFVTTGAVRGRYERDSTAFSKQLAFYSALEREFARAASFEAPGSGSEIRIYRRRQAVQWFASRDTVPLPGELRGPTHGGENYFFWNLGLVYESTGRLAQAMDCYRRGLRYPPTKRSEYLALGERLGYCLLAQRGADQALRDAEAATVAGTPGERGAYTWIRDQIASGRPRFGDLAVPRLVPPGS
jgi:tetratricopeptide (TPR) repeat protein